MNIFRKYGLLIVSVWAMAGLTSCKDLSNPIRDEKKVENDAEIRDYLTKNSVTAQSTTEGLYYKVIAPGTSKKKAAVGDELKVFYTVRRLDNVLVDSSYFSLNQPNRAIYGASMLPYLTDEAMKLVFGTPLLSEGDSAVLFVPYNLRSGSGSLLLPVYSPLRLNLKVVKISTETEQIDAFIAENKIKITETTTTGLRFGKTVSYPDSAMVTEGSVLKVKYTGRRMDNSVFDSGTISVTPVQNKVVPGFKEGLLKMRAGEKANLIFPSALGYGTQGQQGSTTSTGIAPYAPLYFEVEIISKTN